MAKRRKVSIGCDKEPESGYKPMGYVNVLSLYVAITSGIAVALFILILELCNTKQWIWNTWKRLFVIQSFKALLRNEISKYFVSLNSLFKCFDKLPKYEILLKNAMKIDLSGKCDEIIEAE